MPIKRTKYCGYKPCRKPIKSGVYCSLECGIAHSREKMMGPVKNREKADVKKYMRGFIGEGKLKSVKVKDGVAHLHYQIIRKPHPKKVKINKPIRKVSKKRAARLKEYTLKRAAFLQYKICPITGRPATEIHHIRGRDNEWLNDIRFWLAVTREGHIWIHEHPKEAEEKGYIVKRSTKNK